MWGRAALMAAGILAAVVAALLLLPIRIVMTLSGENAAMRVGAAVCPWPFLFSVPVALKPANTQFVPAEGQSLADKLVEIAARARRIIAVLSTSAAPRHRIIDFTLRLSLGVGDAAATAMLAGLAHAVLWSGLRTIFARADSPSPVPDVSITPVYSGVGLRVHVSVTVQLRPIGLVRSQRLWRSVRRVARDTP